MKPHVIGAAISKRSNTTLHIGERGGGGGENIAVVRKTTVTDSTDAANTLWNM